MRRNPSWKFTDRGEFLSTDIQEDWLHLWSSPFLMHGALPFLTNCCITVHHSAPLCTQCTTVHHCAPQCTTVHTVHTVHHSAPLCTTVHHCAHTAHREPHRAWESHMPQITYLSRLSPSRHTKTFDARVVHKSNTCIWPPLDRSEPCALCTKSVCYSLKITDIFVYIAQSYEIWLTNKKVHVIIKT